MGYEKLKEFVQNDNNDLLRVLVLNEYDEYEIRDCSSDLLNSLLDSNDKQILALSTTNYDCMINCCDNCSHEIYDSDTNTYSCSEDKDKVFCAVETELQNWEYYELILKNYKQNKEKRSIYMI